MLKDQKGFATVSLAISLPFILGLGALAYDLGNGLRSEARLQDSFQEATLLFNANKDAKLNIADEVKKIARIYVGEKDIKNIAVEKIASKSSRITNSSFLNISGNMTNNGIFTAFINNLDSKNLAVQSVAKLESTKDLESSDFVFAVAFTDSAAQDTSMTQEARKSLCARPQLIEHGVCNSPLRSPSGIDASQSIVAEIVRLAKGFDSENRQLFGFIPYSGGAQVKGKDLSSNANIDKSDGLSQAERDKANYVVWPIDFFLTTNYDRYSRYYPTAKKKDLFDAEMINNLSNASGDVKSLLYDVDAKEFFTSKFILESNNTTLSFNKKDIDEGNEVLNKLYQNSSPIGQKETDVSATIRNIFNENKQLVYRLYDPKVDTITLTQSVDNIKAQMKETKKLREEYFKALSTADGAKKIKSYLDANPSPSGSVSTKQSVKQNLQTEVDKLYIEIKKKAEDVKDNGKSVNKFFSLNYTFTGDCKDCNKSFAAEKFQTIIRKNLKGAATQIDKIKQEEVPKFRAKEELVKSIDALDDGAFNNMDSFIAKLLEEARDKRAKLDAKQKEMDGYLITKGKALCNSALRFSAGGSCQSTTLNTLKWHQVGMLKLKDALEIKKIDMINKNPFGSKRGGGGYYTGVPYEKDYGSIGLIRAATMLDRADSPNPRSKILLFTSSANKDDEKLVQGGLCQAITTGLKSRKGIDAEIYVISLGLIKNNPKSPASLDRFKNVWKACTPHVLTGDTVDQLFDAVQKDVFSGSFGKFTFDSVKSF